MTLDDLLRTYCIESISLVCTYNRFGLQICFTNLGNYYILFEKTLRDEDLFYSSDFVRQKFIVNLAKSVLVEILNLQNVVIVKHEHGDSYSIRISKQDGDKLLLLKTTYNIDYTNPLEIYKYEEVEK